METIMGAAVYCVGIKCNNVIYRYCIDTAVMTLAGANDPMLIYFD